MSKDYAHLTYADVGRIIHVPAKTVRNWCEKHGIRRPMTYADMCFLSSIAYGRDDGWTRDPHAHKTPSTLSVAVPNEHKDKMGLIICDPLRMSSAPIIHDGRMPVVLLWMHIIKYNRGWDWVMDNWQYDRHVLEWAVEWSGLSRMCESRWWW